MPEKRTKALEAYLDALAARDGAVAALQFLSNDRRTECETLIHELNLKLNKTAAEYGKNEMAAYKAASDARWYNTADLVAHLERMGPHVAPGRAKTRGIFLESMLLFETDPHKGR